MIYTLFVVGNGFDLYHGLNTKYSDFKKWMYYHHPIVLDELIRTYDISGEWWNDFELNLGKLDIIQYREKHHSDIPDWAKEEYYSHLSFPTQGISSGLAPSGNRLRELYSLLDLCFREWVKDTNVSFVEPLLRFPTDNSKFLSFNYTTVLENTYHIPSSEILHIHGCVHNSEKLIFGHNTSPMFWEVKHEEMDEHIRMDNDMMKVEYSFGSKEKFPMEFISRNHDFFDFLPNVKDVYFLGFSFSPVDDEYAFYIRSRAPKAMWHISWYRESDKTQIKSFFDENPYEFRQLEYEYIRMDDLT